MTPKKSSLQSRMPEAVGSANCKVIDPNGLPWQVTLRKPSFESLLEQMSVASQTFIKDGYKPDIKSGFSKAKKPVETVPGRQCPTCANPLVYFESKGQKHIKCSTQKWDFTTKQATGCSFVEWADKPATAPPQALRAIPPTTPAPFEPATQSQITLISTKCLEQYREGLSKQEASQIISQYLSK